MKEKFQSDLTRKLRKDLISLDFSPGNCSCNGPTKTPEGICRYGNNCNTPIVLYEVTCKCFQKKYIGATQKTLKERMKGHYSDVRLWFRKGKHTDTFAKHFVRHFNSQPTAGQIREKCEFKIIRTINPFSFMRGIRTFECRLCMEEKIEIVEAKQNNPRNLMNDNSDIYGPCRHRTKFHRFQRTDELCESEKNSNGTRKNLRRNLICLQENTKKKKRKRKRAPFRDTTNVRSSERIIKRTIEI